VTLYESEFRFSLHTARAQTQTHTKLHFNR